MNATIIARTPTSFTLQVEVPYNASMLDFEEALQQRLNEAGVVATAEGLQQFDTDGSPITVGSVKFTTKGQVEKDYQTPYGVATIARHGGDQPGRDLYADVRGRLAGGDGRHLGLLRSGGGAAAHDLPGGDPGVR